MSVAAAVGVAGLALLAGGCSGGDDPAVVLPSSLATVPSTAGDTTGSSTAPATDATVPTSATVSPVVSPPSLTDVRATVTGSTCPGPDIPVVVTFASTSEPPVRSFSAFVEGTQVGVSTVMGPMTIAVPCDGVAHSILVVATGEDGRSSTQAVAVLTPKPG